jgi:mRNA-degrading endonuclease RelE of RelBE toxin-antitoxin system
MSRLGSCNPTAARIKCLNSYHLEKVLSVVPFSLKILRPARKKLDKIDNDLAGKIYAQIENLKDDPYRPRPGMDIVKIEGNLRPPGYRLRIGRWRVEYVVLDEKHEVRIGRIFPRHGDSDYK